MPRLSRRLLPRFAAGAVALIGAALIAVGGIQAGSRSPADTGGTFRSGGAEPVTTAVGLLGLGGPRVTVQAGGNGPVFLGIARAPDVDAFLSGAARTELIGYDGKGGLIARRAGSGALPDPTGADIWAVSTRGSGAVALVWPNTPGQWTALATGAGRSTGPGTLTMTWSGVARHSTVPELIAIGLLLTVAGGVTLALLWSRERLSRAPGGDPSPTEVRPPGDPGETVQLRRIRARR